MSFEKILAYPNPFGDLLHINIKAKQGDDVKISVFTVSGEKVKKNLSSVWLPDPVNFFKSVWDGKNNMGEEVANGIYLIYVSINGHSELYKVAKLE